MLRMLATIYLAAMLQLCSCSKMKEKTSGINLESITYQASSVPTVGRTRRGYWVGDPHFFGDDLPRSDPLRPGAQWAVKQECPDAKNWMWIQELQGPRGLSFGVAFGGQFIQGHVLRVVAEQSGFSVAWDDTPIQSGWTSTNLLTNVAVSFSSWKFEATFDGWVHYSGRLSNYWRGVGDVFDGHAYGGKWINSNRLSWGQCQGGRFLGLMVEGNRHESYSGGGPSAGPDRAPPDNANMFLKESSVVVNYLNSLTELVRSRCFERSGTWGSLTFTEIPETAGDATWDRGCPPCQVRNACEPKAGLLLADVSSNKNQSDADDLNCTGETLLDAHSDCDAVASQPAWDNEDTMTHLDMYRSCMMDHCTTASIPASPTASLLATTPASQDSSNQWGVDDIQADHDIDNEKHLQHKENFSSVSPGQACPSDKPIKVDELVRGILSPDEVLAMPACSRGQPSTCDACVMTAFRGYIVGYLSQHNKSDECGVQRLAMPKTQSQRLALNRLQLGLSVTAKGWLGGVFTQGKWRWEDTSDVLNGAPAAGTEGDFLCMERASAALVNCRTGATLGQVDLDSLCEVRFQS